MAKIYTKSGDQGMTHMIGGRACKDDILYTVLGDLDELNAVLGMCGEKGIFIYTKIQQWLLDLGAQLPRKNGDWKWDPEYAVTLEKDIDNFSENLAPLKTFIIPHGASAPFHLARAVCRRAERNYWTLVGGSKDPVKLEIGKFLNRLSDWLFVFARGMSTDKPYNVRTEY